MENQEEKHFKLFGLTFPVHRLLLIQLTLFIWVVMLVLLALSTYFFDYEMTNADLPCGAVAGFLTAYLVTILIR